MKLPLSPKDVKHASSTTGTGVGVGGVGVGGVGVGVESVQVPSDAR